MKFKLLLCALASLSMSGCVTYTSEYANDGYYSSPGDSYYDDYGDDQYYGSPGNYGQYSYGSGGYSNISITFNFGGGYPYYSYYPSYYGYSQCSPWSVYCYGGHPGYGWGHQPYYGYYPHHPRPSRPHPKPKPNPPKHDSDNPEQNAGQPGFHPGYPVVDREDGPRPRQPRYRPINSVPQQQGQTQPIANGATPNTPQYPRQQPRQRPITLPVQDARVREDERYVEREAIPRQLPKYSQRPQQRVQPVYSDQPTGDYVRFSQPEPNTPVQQGRVVRNRPQNSNQQVNRSVVVAQQMPQQQAQPRPQQERRERVESKPRVSKVEPVNEGDKP